MAAANGPWAARGRSREVDLARKPAAVRPGVARRGRRAGRAAAEGEAPPARLTFACEAHGRPDMRPSVPRRTNLPRRAAPPRPVHGKACYAGRARLPDPLPLASAARRTAWTPRRKASRKGARCPEVGRRPGEGGEKHHERHDAPARDWQNSLPAAQRTRGLSTSNMNRSISGEDADRLLAIQYVAWPLRLAFSSLRRQAPTEPAPAGTPGPATATAARRSAHAARRHRRASGEEVYPAGAHRARR